MARILIVDDSPTETYRFKEILERNGHVALEATNGADGVALDVVAARLQCRHVELDTAKLQSFEDSRRTLQSETEQLQAERNAGAKKIGQAKRSGEDVAPIMARMQEVNERLETVKVELETLQNDISAFAMAIPNLPHESVPAGKGEDDNVEVHRWGTIRAFDFEPKDHADLGY